MFTKSFTLDQHIEELRAELRGTADPQDAADIQSELVALLIARDLNLQSEA